MNDLKHKTTVLDYIARITGALLLLIIWCSTKYLFTISDRYLPGPMLVLTAFHDIDPSIFVHTAATLARLLLGGLLGIVFGVGVAIAMHRFTLLRQLILPTVQALRSVPSIATVPFFLLWFGFEEIGKILLIVMGIGLNVLVGALQILSEISDKYRIALNSMGHSINEFPFRVALPIVLERMLPTIRTALSIAFGVVIVAELLGSQLGLGYLIQTSRTTYSIHVIFLVTIVLGILNVLLDLSIMLLWRKIVLWV